MIGWIYLRGSRASWDYRHAWSRKRRFRGSGSAAEGSILNNVYVELTDHPTLRALQTRMSYIVGLE